MEKGERGSIFGRERFENLNCDFLRGKDFSRIAGKFDLSCKSFAEFKNKNQKIFFD